MAEKAIEGTKAALQTPAARKVVYWLEQLKAADKREKTYRKKANEVVDIYEAAKVDANSYNILFANTETLQPALYSQEPRPVVRQRASNPLKPDPIREAARRFMQRELEFLVDQGDDNEYEGLDELMKQAVVEALVPGRGLTRFKLDSYEKGGALRVCGESVPWDRFRHGYAKQWKQVPWIEFDHFFTKEELLANFDKAIVNKMNLTDEESDAAGQDDEGKAKPWGADEAGNSAGKGESKSKLAWVAEIWDKDTRKVIFVSPAYPEGPLKEVDDPFGLAGFWPMPKPLQLARKIRSLTPVPIYSFYEQQHKELNVVTQRIMAITRALKVRGAYDARVGELEKIFNLNDNEMAPAESMQSLDPGVTLDRSIWFMPVEKLIQVLTQLYVNRAQIKEIIYELTGIADIMRGASAASETLGAQQIKERWGGVRLKRMQKETARYARDCMRLMAELATNKLDEQTLAGMVQLPLADTERKKQAQAALQQAKAQPGSVAPETLQQMEQALQLPSYGEVIQFLRDDKLRSYSLDIETNSTVDLDMTEDKKDIAEMMTAMGQFLNGVGPLVKEGALPFEGAKAMLVAISDRFRFGQEVKEILLNMQAPKSPDDGAAQAKAAEVQGNLKLKADEQAATMKMKQDQQIFDQQLAREKHQNDMALAKQKAIDDAALAQQKAVAEARLQGEKNQMEDKRAEREGQRARDVQKNLDIKQQKQIDQLTSQVETLGKTLSELVKALGKGMTQAPKPAEGKTL